jgi:ribose transport system substrate-binding protein
MHGHPGRPSTPGPRRGAGTAVRGLALVVGLAAVGGAAAAPGWDGPTSGPPAQPSKVVFYIASDSSNGGVTGAFRGFEEAAARLGWHAEFLDGGGQPSVQGTLLRQAIEEHADGIIFGGFDAGAFKPQVAAARKAGIPLVGWHAAGKPGPTRELFTNVSTTPEAVARLAVGFVLKDAAARHRPAGVVIFTDPQFAVATAKTRAMIKALAAARAASGARVLAVENVPLADAANLVPRLVPALAAAQGAAWNYTLAVNDAYFDDIDVPLRSAHRRDIRNVSAGDGSSEALARISAGPSQQAATVAEPLRLQGYQLADEMNRAFAGAPPSGYVARPMLVTAASLQAAGDADLGSDLGFEGAYTRIWAGK